MRIELKLLIAAVFCTVVASQHPGYVTIVGPPCEVVTIGCNASGNDSKWLVNGHLLTDAEKEELKIVVDDNSSDDTYIYTILTVTLLPINDGIDISCLIRFTPGNVTHYNKVAKLKVRGVSQVRNLTLNYTALLNYSMISWLPSIHSNDVSNADIVYEVSFVSKGKYLKRKYTTDTCSELTHITKCDQFNVSVQAFTEEYSSSENVKENNGTTYRVKSFNLTLYSNGSVGVTCLYYCWPIGCHVIFHNKDLGQNQSFDITTLNEELVYPSESGCYTVTVYDLYNGSFKGPAADPIEIEVIVPPNGGELPWLLMLLLLLPIAVIVGVVILCCLYKKGHFDCKKCGKRHLCCKKCC